MPDIIQQIREALATGENADILHTLLPELLKAADEGKIVELPCKAGDKGYILIPSYSTGSQLLGILPAPIEIAEMAVWGIEIRNGSIWITDGDRYSGEFGKTVFLTECEAEAHLKNV